MSFDRRDPEYWYYVRDKKIVVDEAFRKGLLGESAYLLSLRIWGYTAAEQRQELEFRRMEMGHGVASDRGLHLVRDAGRFVDSRRARPSITPAAVR